MPDRTTRGRPVDAASVQLAQRKIDVQLKSLELEEARKEVEIMEWEAQIVRNREVIEGIRAQRAQLEESARMGAESG